MAPSRRWLWVVAPETAGSGSQGRGGMERPDLLCVCSPCSCLFSPNHDSEKGHMSFSTGWRQLVPSVSLPSSWPCGTLISSPDSERACVSRCSPVRQQKNKGLLALIQEAPEKLTFSGPQSSCLLHERGALNGPLKALPHCPSLGTALKTTSPPTVPFA